MEALREKKSSLGLKVKDRLDLSSHNLEENLLKFYMPEHLSLENHSENVSWPSQTEEQKTGLNFLKQYSEAKPHYIVPQGITIENEKQNEIEKTIKINKHFLSFKKHDEIFKYAMSYLNDVHSGQKYFSFLSFSQKNTHFSQMLGFTSLIGDRLKENVLLIVDEKMIPVMTDLLNGKMSRLDACPEISFIDNLHFLPTHHFPREGIDEARYHALLKKLDDYKFVAFVLPEFNEFAQAYRYYSPILDKIDSLTLFMELKKVSISSTNSAKQFFINHGVRLKGIFYS